MQSILGRGQKSCSKKSVPYSFFTCISKMLFVEHMSTSHPCMLRRVGSGAAVDALSPQVEMLWGLGFSVGLLSPCHKSYYLHLQSLDPYDPNFGDHTESNHTLGFPHIGAKKFRFKRGHVSNLSQKLVTAVATDKSGTFCFKDVCMEDFLPDFV